MIIAIDGPAAAGKGTLARALAGHLNLAYLDTGALYRAVGLKAKALDALDQAAPVAKDLQQADLDHPDLRSAQAGILASAVAKQPDVRQALLDFQRNFGLHPPVGYAGAILDGRDIGTVIFPAADLKFYITAPAEVRAQRRHQELDPENRPSLSAMVAQIQARDVQDAGRKDAPMRAAKDAHVIDTGSLDAAEVFNLALSFVPKGV